MTCVPGIRFSLQQPVEKVIWPCSGAFAPTVRSQNSSESPDSLTFCCLPWERNPSLSDAKHFFNTLVRGERNNSYRRHFQRLSSDLRRHSVSPSRIRKTSPPGFHLGIPPWVSALGYCDDVLKNGAGRGFDQCVLSAGMSGEFDSCSRDASCAYRNGPPPSPPIPHFPGFT